MLLLPESAKYRASDIQILEGLEAVRKRPGMYIGDTGIRGLHHLLYEIIDNSIDEALAGYARNIEVVFYPDGSVSVTDDGRGIPVDIHPQTKKSGVEVVMTMLHAGGKFSKKLYKVSGGLHGVGASVVNALSLWLEVEVFRDGYRWKQRFERGRPVTPLRKLEPTNKRGTSIRFKPDPEIFSDTEFSYEIVKGRLRELAFLVSGVNIKIKDKRKNPPMEEGFSYEGGIVSFVEFLTSGRDVLFRPPIFISGFKDDVYVDVAIQYENGDIERVYTFANLIPTKEGGTHLSGFRSALTRAVNEMAEKNKLFSGRRWKSLAGEDLREGLVAVVSVKLPEPQFEGQTKNRLGNSEVKGIVESIVYDGLKEYFEENENVLKVIFEKALRAREIREAERKARELARRKNALYSFDLPAKLADCSSRKPSECELYIVEGDSAGGSAKQGRDRHFQAVLPLRGKILNVEKASMDKALSNAEIKSLVQALGCGIGSHLDISKLRYHKIIIMTDADVDGAHIRTLLLTFFFRYMREVIEGGYLYIAQPPLYLVRHGKKVVYCYSDEELKRYTAGLKGGYTVQRYKGLGEMNPSQLWETTMDPKRRVLYRVELEDAIAAEELFSVLMGDKVEPRRKFIEEHAQDVRNLDV